MSEVKWVGCGPSCCRCHCDCPQATQAREEYQQYLDSLTEDDWAKIEAKAAEEVAKLQGWWEGP